MIQLIFCSELQAVPGLEPDLINGWNCNFTRDLSHLKTLPLNPASQMELLAGEADTLMSPELYFIFSSPSRIFPVHF